MSKTSDSHDRDSSAGEVFSVQRVASLAKLAPGNGDQVQEQLQRILGFVAVLEELNLDGVEPFFGATDLRSDQAESAAPQPIRDDQPAACLSRELALKNSPSGDDEFYLVPPVFD